MSAEAKKAKGQQIRGWHLNRRSGTDLSGIAQGINPQVRGWINHYGAFYRSVVFPRTAHRRASGQVGHAEVQTTAREASAGMGPVA
jgi:hypothetical protein